MKILVLGNEFIKEDSLAKKLSIELKKEFKEMEFININDFFQLLNYLQFKDILIILDVVKDISFPKILKITDLKNKSIVNSHDFDAGFFLKLAGKEQNLKIIGVPVSGEISTIKKEVIKLLKIIFSFYL
jgi:Ni,Fe-hydrogenase maturation factor